MQMGYEHRLTAKIERLMHCFPSPSQGLRPLFEEVLFNVSVKDSDLINVLKFLDGLQGEERRGATQLFAAVWPQSCRDTKAVGLSEDKQRRDQLKKELFEKIDVIRRYARTGPLSRKHLRQIMRVRRILSLHILDVLRIVTVSPHILRGLRKSPRPIYSWIIPTFLAASASYGLLHFAPALPAGVLVLFIMLTSTLGTYYVSIHCKIAPGVLCYERTRKYLTEIIGGTRRKSRIQERMEELGLNLEEIGKQRVYERTGKGVRIVIRNKKTLEGAVRFLTSSDEIGSCAALQNFVSWTLPSLLDDDGVLLADVYRKGARSVYRQRAQIWMVAAEEDGEPVLAVNSFEFNNEGARHIDELMEEMVEAVRDVAERGGFRKVYVGISTFGRHYLDSRFRQGQTRNTVRKIHDPEAGYRYYFDAFGLRVSFKNARLRREYVYQKKRGPVRLAYALVFGVIELLKGNASKANCFFDTLRSRRNFWEIPLITCG